MRRLLASRRSTKSLRVPLAVIRQRLAIVVVIFFIGVCLGRWLAPDVQVFSELLPIAAGLFGLVVRYHFLKKGGS
jgi:hypothetical protein